MKRILAALLLLVASAVSVLAASTVNPNVPASNSPLTSAPVRSNFLAAYTDINNILGVFAGVNPPAAPTNLQSWADTSASPNYVFKYWNAQTTTWVAYGTLNVNTGTFSPYGSAASFLGTAPIAVSVTGGVVTYSLNKNGNFATVANNLAFASIASGSLLANCGATTAEPTGCTWSSYADRVVGGTNGLLPYRTGGAWGSVSTGTAGHTLPFLDTLNTWSVAQNVYPGAGTLPAALTGSLVRATNLDGTTTIFEADSYGANGSFSCVRTSGTIAAKLTLSANDQICSFSAHGYDGTAFSTVSAGVRMFASQTWTNAAHGSYIRLSTTPNGSTTIADRVGIEQDGGVTVPPTVTGGSLGAGTVNASGLYWNGVAIGTAALQNIGTSGANVPLLSTVNTWGAAQTIPGLIATGTFTATGLVKNADLVNSSTTVNGQVCVLGATCTISASAGTITVGVTNVASGVTNGILYNMSGGLLGNLATANNGVLATDGTGLPAIVTTLPSALTIPSPTLSGTMGGTAVVPSVALVNTAVSAASYGSSTAIPTFTVNTKGQLTAAATAAVVAPAGTLTGTALPAAVVTSSLTSVGALTSGSLGSGFTTVDLLRGGSSNTTAAGARGPTGFNIDQMTTIGDANLSITATTRTVATTTTLTATRTFTLPLANAINAGQTIVVLDQQGAVNGANVITVAAAGADTINGVTSVNISTQYGGAIFTSNGSNKWTSFAAGGGGGGGGTVTQVNAGTGLNGGPITTTGTLNCNTASSSVVGCQKLGAWISTTVASPTASGSTSGVMMGLGTTCTITPQSTGRVRFEITGTQSNNVANNFSSINMRYGVGAAPANGVAFVGTSVGSSIAQYSPGASFPVAFATNGIIGSLAIGTAVWFDINLSSQANTSSIASLWCHAFEF